MTTTETAIRITLALISHPLEQRAFVTEAVLHGLGTDDPLPAAETRLLELEGDSGIPLNMRGAGSQP